MPKKPVFPYGAMVDVLFPLKKKAKHYYHAIIRNANENGTYNIIWMDADKRYRDDRPAVHIRLRPGFEEFIVQVHSEVWMFLELPFNVLYLKGNGR